MNNRPNGTVRDRTCKALHRLAVALCASISLPIYCADLDNPRVQVGEKTIILPLVEGYPRLDGKSKELDETIGIMAHGGNNRVVALYGTERDLGQILKGKKPDLTKTITVQSALNFEGKKMPKAVFPLFKNQIKKDVEQASPLIKQLLEDIEVSSSTAITKQDKILTKMTYGSVVPLGIFDETENSLSHSVLAKAQAKTSKGVTDVVQASSASLVYLDGKLLTVYASTLYKSPDDLKWTRKMALQVRDALLKANKGENAPQESKSDDSFVTIKLPYGMSVSAPGNWWVLGKDAEAYLKTKVEAVQKLTKLPAPRERTALLRVNSMPRSTYASLSIVAIDSTISLEEYEAITPSDLRQTESEQTEIATRELATQGVSLLTPCKITKETLNGIPALSILSIRYRKDGKKGPVSVEIISLFLKEKELTITLAYRESEAEMWKPVIDHIRASIRQD